MSIYSDKDEEGLSDLEAEVVSHQTQMAGASTELAPGARSGATRGSRNGATTATLQKVLPSGSRNLRACMLCSIVLTARQFEERGCPNCENILRTTERMELVTSPNHEGRIAVMRPHDSWVARWQRTADFVGGLYATKVQGKLPDDIKEELEADGVIYRARDGSVVD
ncbi:transcription elongation factor spt4 [Savitreella phatthalungensis]